FEELAKDPKLNAAAAIGINLALQSRGEYDKAADALDAALNADSKNADLHARRAELLYLRGRWEDAEKASGTALELSKDHFRARWIRAQVFRDRGELDKAEQECKWFVRTYSERSNADMDIKDVDDLLLVGLAGSENARWNNLSDQFTFILN